MSEIHTINNSMMLIKLQEVVGKMKERVERYAISMARLGDENTDLKRKVTDLKEDNQKLRTAFESMSEHGCEIGLCHTCDRVRGVFSNGDAVPGPS